MEFTENTFKVTYEVCPINFFIRGAGEEFYKGWKVRVIDCNNGELYKGSEVIKLNGSSNAMGREYSVRATYNNKSCTLSPKTSLAEKKAACETAYDTYLEVGGDYYDIERYYGKILSGEAEFYKCVKENGPQDFKDWEGNWVGGGDDGSVGEDPRRDECFFPPLSKQTPLHL
jgi:hypothetical protein